MTLRETTAALFVLALSLILAMVGWAVADVLGLLVGLAVGLLAADRITRVVEDSDVWSVVTRRR